MKVFFYQNEDGSPLVKEWIDDQESGAKAKIYRDLTLLQEYGLALGMPYIRKTPSNEIRKATKRLQRYLKRK